MRMIRSATNSSTPPRAASGTCLSSAAPNTSSASTIAAANSDDNCDRPPVSHTMPVRGGLASTGNAPNRPARMLPAPTPRKSRSTSAGLSGSDGKARVVADVCTMTTMAIRRLNGTRWAHRSKERTGSDGVGSVAGTVPTTATPLLSRPAQITATVAATRPISAPGMRALIASEKATTANTPSPMQTVKMLASERCRASTAIRCGVGPLGCGSPSTPGSCETRMCTEMPARKPTVTGIDNRLAMPPSSD